jgi:hypothetical protein
MPFGVGRIAKSALFDLAFLDCNLTVYLNIPLQNRHLSSFQETGQLRVVEVGL